MHVSAHVNVHVYACDVYNVCESSGWYLYCMFQRKTLSCPLQHECHHEACSCVHVICVLCAWIAVSQGGLRAVFLCRKECATTDAVSNINEQTMATLLLANVHAPRYILAIYMYMHVYVHMFSCIYVYTNAYFIYIQDDLLWCMVYLPVINSDEYKILYVC